MTANGIPRPGPRDVERDVLLPKLVSQPSCSSPTLAMRHRQYTVQELQAVDPAVDTQRSKQSRFESLDYEEVENIVYRSDKAATGSLDGLAVASSKWLVCFLIGVITATAAFLVNLAVENISGFKFYATLTLLSRGFKLGSFLAYTAMNAALVLLAVAITLFVGPAAAGSGIPDVKAYLNGIDVPGIFYLSTLIAKLLGSVAAVAGGLAIGKEGPFVHAGACVAALVSQGGTANWQVSSSKHMWNDRDRADMVTVGTAAGVAAAFRSPVGGVLFALEEMSSWWRNQLMWLIFFTTAVVSVTIRVLMKMCSGDHCGFFGSGGFIYFEIQAGQEAYEVYELLPMLLLGVVGGLLGSSFIVCNARLSRWRRSHIARYGVRGRVVEGLVISVLTSTVSFVLPLLFMCQRCPSSAGDACPRKDDSHSGNFVSFGCTRPNTYNDLATLFFNTQDDAIRALFSSSTKREYTVPTLIIFVTAFYWLSVLTYGMSCPTGFFVPAILCGAAYGRLVGIFVAERYPNQHIDEGTYALLGAASFLGGSMRLTMCTCVMLLELTNNLALLPLIMLVLLVAKGVGDGTGIKPIYEVQMHYKGLPFLDPSPEPVMRHVTAKECCGKPPVLFNRIERVQHIVEVLKTCNHNGFPVMHNTSVEGDKALAGVVLRQHLLLLLTTRNAFQPAPYITETASRIATTYNLADFCKPMSAPGLSINDVMLTPEELCQYLDLGPYLNPSYYVVQDDASLSKVYTLFRTLGLRHLCVIPKAQEVVGIITREDLQTATLAERLERNGGQFGTDGTFNTSPSRRWGANGWSGDESNHSVTPSSDRGSYASLQLSGEAVRDGMAVGRGGAGRSARQGGAPDRDRSRRASADRLRHGTQGSRGAGLDSQGLGGFGSQNFGGNSTNIRFTEQRGIDLMPQLGKGRAEEVVGALGGVGGSGGSRTGPSGKRAMGGGYPITGLPAQPLHTHKSGDAGTVAGGIPGAGLKVQVPSVRTGSVDVRDVVPSELLVDSPAEGGGVGRPGNISRRSGNSRSGQSSTAG